MTLHTHTYTPVMCSLFNELPWHSRATPVSFIGHFCILTANQASISSVGVLPSGCAMPNYVLDAQPILQLQCIPHKRRSFSTSIATMTTLV